MQKYYQGAMIGAAIGDALGMPYEAMPGGRVLGHVDYMKAPRQHPNAGLKPGQYTDDTQIMLLVAGLLAEGIFSADEYAKGLLALSERLRFPDGSVMTACERLNSAGPLKSGVFSTTSGCIPPGLPFALAYHNDPVALRENLVSACAVTHTHPAAHAAAVAFAMLIAAEINGMENPFEYAWQNADAEDSELGARLATALRLENEGISLEAALSVIGNDVSVYQTLPLAFFLIRRYQDPVDLLRVGTGLGGNTDTVGFICGAYIGATLGTTAFPENLLRDLEDPGHIRGLANRLFRRCAGKD